MLGDISVLEEIKRVLFWNSHRILTKDEKWKR